MSATILVIEDDPASLELMTYLLAAHGYRPISAARGDSGLAMVRERNPDLIICDIQLPGLDGYAVARAMKSDAALCATPIVAVSAMAMVGDREKGLSAGFDAYVAKPIDPMTFIAQIQPLLRPEHRSTFNVPAQPRSIAEHTRPCHGTLLAVDDDVANLELKRSIFEPLGYRVLTAETVAAGLELARTHHPALIISDLSLPEEGGFGLLRTVKQDEQLQRIPVIIMTATFQDAVAQARALSLGAARFLLRPLDAEQVVREVEACLADAARSSKWPQS